MVSFMFISWDSIARKKFLFFPFIHLCIFIYVRLWILSLSNDISSIIVLDLASGSPFKLDPVDAHHSLSILDIL